MTHDLRSRVDDLLADVPRLVHPDARAAWAAGARRRHRRRVAGAAGVVGVVGVVAVLAAGVGTLPRGGSPGPAGSSGRGVDQFPTRLQHPYWSGDLPDTPGPVAALVERGDDDGSLGWYAVSPTGHLWELPGSTSGVHPALSDDGTALGYLDDSVGHYRTRDLVTGATRDYPTYGTTTQHQLGIQLPAFWSPDSSTIALFDGHLDLLGPGTSVVRTRAPRVPGGVAHLVGWVDDTHVGWLASVGNRQGSAEDLRPSASLVVTDRTGTVTRTVPLDLGRDLTAFLGSRGGGFDQWSGSLSPDGALLAVQADGPLVDSTTVVVLDTSTGRAVHRAVSQTATAEACGLSWDGSDPVATVVDAGGGAGDELTTRLLSPDADAAVRADPRLGIDCAAWASDALGGTPHHGLAGLLFDQAPDAPLAWRWRETGWGVLVLAGLVVAARRWRQGRHRRTRSEG